MVVVLVAGGCSSRPYAATYNHQLAHDDLNPDEVWDSSEAARYEQSMVRFADGKTATRVPSAAKDEIRWSDLESAVLFACDDAEMAVVHATKHDWGMEYELRTIEDYPGTLIVKQTHDSRIYEAQATIGRFGDRTDRAKLLLEALDRQWRAFGQKRSIRAD